MNEKGGNIIKKNVGRCENLLLSFLEKNKVTSVFFEDDNYFIPDFFCCSI